MVVVPLVEVMVGPILVVKIVEVLVGPIVIDSLVECIVELETVVVEFFIVLLNSRMNNSTSR